MFKLPVPGIDEDEKEEEVQPVFTLPTPTISKFELPEPLAIPKSRGEAVQQAQNRIKLPSPKVGTSEVGKPVADNYGLLSQEETEAQSSQVATQQYDTIFSATIPRVIAPFARQLQNVMNIGSEMFDVKPVMDLELIKKVDEDIAWHKLDAEERGNYLEEIATEIAPIAENLFASLMGIRGFQAITAGAKGLATAASTLPNILGSLGKTAAYRALTTKGTPVEKLHSATFSTAAAITPFIVNATGASGFGAVACDTMLNMILSNRTYINLIKSCKTPREFIKKVLPHIMIDTGTAWTTRGSTAAQQTANYKKYAKQEGKLITLAETEYKDLVKLAAQFAAEEKLIDRKYIPLFPKKDYNVTSIEGLVKLGNAIQKQIPQIKDLRILWSYKQGKRGGSVYTGSCQKEDGKIWDYEITINTPSDFAKRRGTTDRLSSPSGKFLGGDRRATHGNLVKTILHELAHALPKTDARNAGDRIRWDKLQTEKEKMKFGEPNNYEELAMDWQEWSHPKEFNSWLNANKKSTIWQVKETEQQAVDRRVNEARAERKGSVLLNIQDNATGFIKDYSTFEMVKHKIQTTLGVQDAMKGVGAPETGFHLKNMPGMVAYGHDRGIALIKNLSKEAKKLGITKEDFDGFAELTFMTESGKYRDSLDPAIVKKYQPLIKMVNDYYAKYEKEFKEIGWMDDPFPQSLINRNNADIKSLQDKLPEANRQQAKAIQADIKRLKDTNVRIGEENLSFVSVPIRMILKDNDAAITKHFLNFLPKWGRKTITVKDLVDEGVLTAQQADVRAIVGEYSNRMSKKYALGLVLKSAQDEGMVVSQDKQPNWDIFDEKVSPQLKGKRVNPVFNDLLTAYVGASRHPTTNWQQLVGITKMMQFYNPAILPMYDLTQAFAAGTFTSLKTVPYIYKALKSVITNDESFRQANRDGLASKPFYLKESAYQAQLNKHMEPNTLKKIAKNVLPAIYVASWNAAWKADVAIRMMTYNYFLDKGMASRESAQTAAMFHGDYASVPPNTRKALNSVLFTPSFKISMSKLGANMAKGVFNVAFNYDEATKQDKAYAGGLVRSFAFMEGMEQLMNYMGYNTEEQYRKYSKEVTTDEGAKEQVITFAHPFNLMWRYYYRGKKAFKPDVQNKLDKLCEQAEYDLTPLYNIALRTKRNSYNEAYNPNDDGDKQLGDAVKFILRETVAISKLAFEPERKKLDTKESYNIMKQEMGRFTANFLTPFVFDYIRDIKDIRLKNRITKFKKLNQNILDWEEGDDIDEMMHQYDNYNKKLELLYEEYDEKE